MNERLYKEMGCLFYDRGLTHLKIVSEKIGCNRRTEGHRCIVFSVLVRNTKNVQSIPHVLLRTSSFIAIFSYDYRS